MRLTVYPRGNWPTGFGKNRKKRVLTGYPPLMMLLKTKNLKRIRVSCQNLKSEDRKGKSLPETCASEEMLKRVNRQGSIPLWDISPNSIPGKPSLFSGR